MSKPGVYEDLTGKQFGDLVVLGLNEEETEKTKIKYNKRILTWNCQCSKCGNLSTKHGCDLKKYVRKNQSGCVRCHGIWLVGQKFGRLTVIEDLGCDEKSDRKLRCKCDCGNEVIVSQILLRTGNTQSCGCLQSELTAQRNKETGCWNGDSTNPKYERLYRIWGAMRNRCDSPLNIHYNLYGGKGIKVCDEWYNWFIFKDWALSHGYQDDLTIDRIDGNGNYEPSNCRWATVTEQANNVSTNKLLTYQGRTQTLAQWCDELNLDYFRTKARLNSCDYTVEEAFEFDRYQLRESTLEKIRTSSKCS